MVKKEVKQSSNFELSLRYANGLIDGWKRIIEQAEKQNDLKTLCVLWDTLDNQYEAVDATRKMLLALFERLDKEILPQAFENQKIDKIALPELAKTFYPLHKNSASIVKGRNEEAMSWLRANGLGSLVTETVHRGTLAATLYDRLINEGKDPPESMTLTRYTIISSSKYTPKEK